MKKEIRLGISSCLMGNDVRYNGKEKRDPFLIDTFGPHVEWVPVCPEVECGLPVPREEMHLVRNPDTLRLVTKFTGQDHTDRLLEWAVKKLTTLEGMELSGFIFKCRSPSCGITDVEIHDLSGEPSHPGAGLFAGLFMERFPSIPAEDESRLHNPDLLRSFVQQAFPEGSGIL
jgi:uncharacterized protein YbbK (DUF523 family)